MKRISLLTLSFCCLGCALCHAATPSADNSSVLNASEVKVPECISSIPKELLPENKDVAMDSIIPAFNKALRSAENPHLSPESPEYKVVSIASSEFGQLERLLTENDADAATELIVSGPIDKSDFKELWNCASKGNLRVIDLGSAKIKDNTVPDGALYDPIQLEEGLWLRITKIVLPDDVVRIGQSAFPCMGLEEINIPSSLKEIGPSAFAYDYWLNCPIELPEGMEEIKNHTFYMCRRLGFSPVLPSSMRKIGPNAFSYSSIQNIEFNDGLKAIGVAAFYGCGLKEVRIPDSVVEIDMLAFTYNVGLESISLPKATEVIPVDAFRACYELSTVTLPENVKVIESGAFCDCLALKELAFPETLEIIEDNAFQGCAMDTVVLPSNVRYLGSECFSLGNLHAFYCKSQTPPECELEPLGPFSGSLISEAILYVPKGCKENYQDMWEWNKFKEIIETDEFPLSATPIVVPENPADDLIFDLSGRKIANPLPNQIYIKNGKKILI
ncbi:MAG: leucine-rich repeat domain-containing protein [Muribaculaceae bacterium]|nr:leucine-rich repeat domain-containing protein [Muribaculaceae bacterium]